LINPTFFLSEILTIDNKEPGELKFSFINPSCSSRESKFLLNETSSNTDDLKDFKLLLLSDILKVFDEESCLSE
jgi:hypothetical protein